MPPEWMWLLDEELIDHFDRIKSERQARYGTSSRSNDDDDDNGLMMQNEYARGRGRRT